MFKKFIYGFLLANSPIVATVLVVIILIIVVFAAAGGVLGWLFGGGEPGQEPSAAQAPAGAPNFWTPTVIPSDCYITSQPVGVTATPAPAPPGGGSGSPAPTNPIIYLPTPTPCPMSFFSTPNPNLPPVGAGADGSYDIRQGEITLAKVQQILAQYPLYPLGDDGLPIPSSSPIGPNPLTNVAQKVIDFQNQYHINGGFALAQFVMESGLCTTGISPTAIECGNIVWTSGGNCATHNIVGNHDFCGYANWSDAIQAWFVLMNGYYIPNGLTTVSAIINTYAPCSDNGGCAFVDHYIATVDSLVTQWGVAQVSEASANNAAPHGNPFHSSYWVTQAYGCTNFPEFKDQACAAATGGEAPWFHRGVDIVSKGDPTVYATISGVVDFAGWGDDGFGNRIYVKQGPYLVIYPHLSRILVSTGQQVNWGDAIGVEGSTGYSSGDHLHYEIHINGAWVDSTPYLQKP